MYFFKTISVALELNFILLKLIKKPFIAGRILIKEITNKVIIGKICSKVKFLLNKNKIEEKTNITKIVSNKGLYKSAINFAL